MNTPRYSIIIPVYNTEKYLHECIESIYQQEINNWEIILVDDGSTDDSSRICEEYRIADNRIKCLHKKNEGLSAARNDGVKLSSGEYLLFLDSDDFWIGKNTLSIIEEYSKDVDIMAFGFSRLSEFRYVTKPDETIPDITCAIEGEQFLELVLEKDKLFPWFVWRYLYRRDWWIRNNLSFLPGILYEDVEFTYRALLKAEKVKSCRQKLYGYRDCREGAITQNISTESLVQKFNAAKKAIRDIESNEDISLKLKKGLLDNLSCEYYSILILVNLIPSKEKTHIMKLLEENIWITKYTKRRQQFLIKIFIDLFGLRITSYLLNLRRKLKS